MSTSTAIISVCSESSSVQYATVINRGQVCCCCEGERELVINSVQCWSRLHEGSDENSRQRDTGIDMLNGTEMDRFLVCSG